MLNAALVGLGWWGRTIAATLKESSALRIAAVCDIDPAAGAVAASLGLPLAENFEKILADPAIAAVILATPHSLHAAQIKAAAASGGPAYPIPHAEMLATVAALEAIIRSAGSGNVEFVSPA